MRLTLESLAYGGDAIARMPDGRTAFVSGGCPGDTVEARLLSEHERFARMRVDTVLDPSPDRVEAPCPYFDECGGCQWQHVAYPAQLAAKQAAVTDALTRIGKVDRDVIVTPCAPSPEPYGYRNKIELLADMTGTGLRLGFARRHDATIVPIEACLLLDGRGKRLPKAISGALRYLDRSGELGIERVALRVAGHTKDLEVALWCRPGPFPRRLAAKTIADATGATSVVRVLIKDKPKSRAIAGVEVLKGKGAWRERLAGHSYLVSGPSFFQVNTAGAEGLVETVVSALALHDQPVVADVYAGVGTFSLPIAERAEHVLAIESYGPAIADLRRNVEATDLSVDIVPGDASYVLGDLGAVDRVLVDPPRAGLDERALDSIIGTRAERIVYVSCDPTTLARDAKRLLKHGYALQSAHPIDLFPQTYHVETVAVFVAR